MWIAVSATVLSMVLTTAPLCASDPDSRQVDQQTIEALAARASQAQPREQCFLYAQLVHDMAELSMRKYAAGDVEEGGNILKRIQALARKIRLSIGGDGKRMKNTEILLRHTTFRLTGLLHSSSVEDQPLVAETLASVSKAESEAMLQVFQK